MAKKVWMVVKTRDYEHLEPNNAEFDRVPFDTEEEAWDFLEEHGYTYEPNNGVYVKYKSPEQTNEGDPYEAMVHVEPWLIHPDGESERASPGL